MNLKKKNTESTFIGEISSPVGLDDETDGIDFTVYSLNDVSLEPGAAEFITRSGVVYYGVIRAILQQQRPGSDLHRDREEECHIDVVGLTFTQASQTYRVIQKQEPKILAFIGEARNPFHLPRVTRGFVGLQIRPLQQSDLLHPYGAFRPYGMIHLISSFHEIYVVTIHGSGRPFFDQSKQSQMWHRDITVDGITLNQAQSIHKVLQFVGPQGTKAIGTILGYEQSTKLEKSIDLHVDILQYGLMRKGESKAQLIDISGEIYPVIIRDITAFSNSNTIVKARKHEYIITVDNIASIQFAPLQTLVQDSEPLKDQ